MRKARFGTAPLSCDLRLRHVLFAPLIVYGMLNFVTTVMVMAGAKMSAADPFLRILYAPSIFLFGS